MPGAFLLPALAKSIDEQLRTAGKAASDPGPEGIHDLRVATRRLRAALELWLAARSDRRLERSRKTFRRLGKRLGSLREIDVNIEELSAIRERRPPSAAALEMVLAAELRRRRKREKRLGRELERTDLSELADDVRSDVEDAADAKLGAEPLSSMARRELDSRLPRLMTLCDRARLRPTPRSLHLLRIDLKKFRYSVELCAPAYDGRRAPHLIARLKKLQDALGSAHDADALHARIARIRADFRRDHLPAAEKLLLAPMRDVASLARERRQAAVRQLEASRRAALFSRFSAAIR